MEKVARVQIFACQTFGGAFTLACCYISTIVSSNLGLQTYSPMSCADDCWCDIGFVEATSAWPSLQCVVVRVSDNNDTRTFDSVSLWVCHEQQLISSSSPFFNIHADSLGTCPTAKDENALAANTATKAAQATWQRGTKHFQGKAALLPKSQGGQWQARCHDLNLKAKACLLLFLGLLAAVKQSCSRCSPAMFHTKGNESGQRALRAVWWAQFWPPLKVEPKKPPGLDSVFLLPLPFSGWARSKSIKNQHLNSNRSCPCFPLSLKRQKIHEKPAKLQDFHNSPTFPTSS